MNIQPLLSGRVHSKEQASQETGMPDEILKKRIDRLKENLGLSVFMILLLQSHDSSKLESRSLRFYYMFKNKQYPYPTAML